MAVVPMQIVVNQKSSQRRVLLLCGVALAVLLGLSVKFGLTFSYMIGRMAIFTVGAFFLGRAGASRTRALTQTVGLSMFEQAFLKTALAVWIGPPPGMEGASLAGVFVQMAIGAVAFLPAILIFGLGGFELSRWRGWNTTLK